MEIQYVYQKKRSEFGRQCLFSDKGPELIDNYPPNPRLLKQYILRDPVSRQDQCGPIKAEHSVNTPRTESTISSMNHTEGGWPKDVNTADEEQVKRYKRKIEKDETYNQAMLQLCRNMEYCVLQNNTINIYQHFYSDVEGIPLNENTANTVNAFHDPNEPQRPINHISWSPENRLAVAYCHLAFQAETPHEGRNSYIWDIENANCPLMILKPDYPIVCLEYNQKEPEYLIGGMFNGQVAFWDTRAGSEPVELSALENSFLDPVIDVLWTKSNTGTEFFSASSDGQVKWWDTRKVSKPTDSLILHPVKKKEEQVFLKAMGASVLEYEPTIPTRFMVGTQNGAVLLCSRRGKIPQEKFVYRYDAHFGSVLSLQRNPQFVKNFLTVGDWTARIWAEDCRESAIIWTMDHRALLTGGAWSPTKLSVFFTTRSDGVLDIWDILNQQKQATLSLKICDEPLQCLRAHESGRIIAVGDKNGSVYLIEMSTNLSTSNKNDKVLMTAMFERENKREKILEARNKELRLKQRDQSVNLQQEKEDNIFDTDMFNDPMVQKAEKKFYEIVERTKAEMLGEHSSSKSGGSPQESSESKPKENEEEVTPETEEDGKDETQPEKQGNEEERNEDQKGQDMKLEDTGKEVGITSSNAEHGEDEIEPEKQKTEDERNADQNGQDNMKVEDTRKEVGITACDEVGDK